MLIPLLTTFCVLEQVEFISAFSHLAKNIGEIHLHLLFTSSHWPALHKLRLESENKNTFFNQTTVKCLHVHFSKFCDAVDITNCKNRQKNGMHEESSKNVH